MFSHRHRYLFILALSLYTYINTVLCEVYYYFNITIEWYYALATIAAISLAVWEGSRIIQPWFYKRLKESEHKIKWLLLFFLAGSIVTSAASTVLVFLVSMVLHQHNLAETIVPLKLNLIYAWLANLFFHLVNAIVYYFKEYKTKWEEAEELKIISAQAELQLIKTQINPHFLFNNLNVLSTLVLKNNSEANKFIEAFSKVYRYILTTHDKELVDVKTELNFLNPYIFLLEKRFSDGLSISIDIPEQQQSKYIIPASLQMLIENAIKHNVVSKHKPLHIHVHANSNNSIEVVNNLQPRESAESSTQVGLKNIEKRYLLVSGRAVLIDKNETRFKVTLPLLILN